MIYFYDKYMLNLFFSIPYHKCINSNSMLGLDLIYAKFDLQVRAIHT